MEEQTPWKETRMSMGYSSSSSEARERVARTDFRLLVASDLVPSRTDVDWQSGSKITTVDRFIFNEMLQSLHPELEVDVPNRLDDRSHSLSFQLQFGTPGSFTPSGLVAQIPRLNQLEKVRNLLMRVSFAEVDSVEFRAELGLIGVDDDWAAGLYQELIRQPSPSPSPSSPGSEPEHHDSGGLDSLFSLVDIDGSPDNGAPPTTPSDSAVSALVDAIGSSSETDMDRAGAKKLANQIESIISNQVNEILHDASFQRLESSWLGLKFLVDSIDSRSGVKIQVLPASKDQINEALHYQVLMPNYENPPAVPLAAVILDYLYGDEPIDIERLGDLADSGASMQVPIIAGASDKLWSVTDSNGNKKIPLLSQHMQGPGFIAWNTLRGLPSARFLTLALPGFLLRDPYSADHQDLDMPGFRESVDSDEKKRLWGRASVPMGAALASSFAETGWATHFEGAGSSVKFEGLPVWTVDEMKIPLSCWIPRYKESECADAGLAVLACRSNTDSIYVGRAHTLATIPAYKDPGAVDEAKQNSRLATQMVANKLGNALVVATSKLNVGDTPETIQEVITREMADALQPFPGPLPDETIRVELEDSPNGPTAWGVGVRVTVPPRIVGAELNIAMGFEFPKA